MPTPRPLTVLPPAKAEVARRRGAVAGQARDLARLQTDLQARIGERVTLRQDLTALRTDLHLLRTRHQATVPALTTLQAA